MPEMFSDRRQSIRYDVVTEVTVIHEHGRASVRTRDLSKGGLCMLLPYPLERGAVSGRVTMSNGKSAAGGWAEYSLQYSTALRK